LATSAIVGRREARSSPAGVGTTLRSFGCDG
jgi:hypothetical protein